MRFLWIFLLLPFSLWGNAWYIRTDGGTAAQCTGKVDAPYPGTGSAQACAFSNPFYLWTNDPPQNKAYELPVWKIAGGDTVILKNGDYRMGFKTPDANGWWNYLGCRGNNHNCSNPAIPAGTDDNPTRIVGEGWEMGCPVKPVLRGTGATSTVLNLKDTNHIVVDCIEFTDAAQCRLVTLTGEPYGCVNYKTDHAYWALQTNGNTSYVTLRNLFIHGMASTAISGNIGGHILAENVYMRGNGNFGWNFDPGGGVASLGPLTIRNLVVEWSACVERYPLADPVIVACYDQAGANANGDALGFVDLDGDIIIDHAIVRYNQQDGLDALYVKSGKLLSVTNSQFYGNTGQQIKTGGSSQTIIRNNLIVGNCERQREGVEGVTEPDYNKLEKSWCRGADMVALLFKNDTAMSFENNTLVTYNPTGFDIQCRRIEDVFNATGRVGYDGSVDPTLAVDGVRRTYPTLAPIHDIFATGAIYVYPKTGSRFGKRVGKVGAQTDCYGYPCQFWYNPDTNQLFQDPSDTPLQPTDELRVDYAYLGYCDAATISFQNNLVRGYTRLSTGDPAGSFWSTNLNDGTLIDPTRWGNNIYCGMNSFTPMPNETVTKDCPGTFFASEPLILNSERDLDTLDPHLRADSPAVDAGAAIADITTDFDGNPRPSGSAYDVGAFEYTPAPNSTGSGVDAPGLPQRAPKPQPAPSRTRPKSNRL
jgi:hypothetical protein